MNRTTFRATRTAWIGSLAIGIALALPVGLRAQEHQHGAAPAVTGDPLLRLLMESPHLVFEHRGYVGLSDHQAQQIREFRQELCRAEVRMVRQMELAKRELAAAISGEHSDEGGARAALQKIGDANTEWVLALITAREKMHATLTGNQHALVSGLADHWTREFGLMLEEQSGHAAHGGGSTVRVPGLIAQETAMTPYCMELHGPLRHIVVPRM